MLVLLAKILTLTLGEKNLVNFLFILKLYIILNIFFYYFYMHMHRLEGTFLPISRLRTEFAELYKRLVALGSPLVFSHNDLLLGNVIYTESRQAVSFIDYEYADYNFQAFDIGNHFAEFAGVDTVDYSRYPSKEFQMQWLQVYLQSYLRRNVTSAEVERLYVQVNQFALAAHLFWTVWSLIQAEHSNIDFDYVE